MWSPVWASLGNIEIFGDLKPEMKSPRCHRRDRPGQQVRRSSFLGAYDGKEVNFASEALCLHQPNEFASKFAQFADLQGDWVITETRYYRTFTFCYAARPRSGLPPSQSVRLLGRSGRKLGTRLR
jgi:hypothetical protein